MGNAGSSGSQEFALGAIARKTHFTKEELLKFRQAFMEVAVKSPDIGNAVISQEQFGEVMALVEVPASNSSFMSLLFNAFDKNGDGLVNFVEFTAGLSMVLKGSPAEKYQLCFEIYDVKKTGFITKPEMRQVVASMNLVLRASESSNRGYTDDDLDAFVATVFSEAGQPEKLTFDDFISEVSKHPELVDF